MSFTGGVARCQCASAIRAIQVRIDDGTLLGACVPFWYYTCLYAYRYSHHASLPDPSRWCGTFESSLRVWMTIDYRSITSPPPIFDLIGGI